MDNKMNKQLRILTSNLQKLYNLNYVKKIALKCFFVKRKGKIGAHKFLDLCVFQGEDLCSLSLAQICAKLDANDGISISTQALNNRFSKNGVNFMRNVFYEMLKIHYKILSQEEKKLKNFFSRIMVADSTILTLHNSLKDSYKGAGTPSSAKVQLQYDLLTGQFSLCEILEGHFNDGSYIENLQQTVKKGDLCLKDLGYFKIEDLKFIESKEAFYVSRIKTNVLVHVENKDSVSKSKNSKDKYSLLDLCKIAKPLAQGETIELAEVFIGNMDKTRIKSRLILSKLTEEDKQKRLINEKINLEKKKKADTEKNKQWCEFSVYITNAPRQVIDTLAVHEVYTLLLQIELMFKIWKSVFKMTTAKKIKPERFECFLYGRLISVLLTVSIVFTARKVVEIKDNESISEIKASGIVYQYFEAIRTNIYKNNSSSIFLLFKRLFNSISRLGIKSKKKDFKTSNQIIEQLELTEFELMLLAS